MTHNDNTPDPSVIDVPPDDPKTPEPADDPKPKGAGFSAVGTANVIARQTDEEVMATIDVLARKRPDLFKSEDDDAPPPPPANDKKVDDPKPDTQADARIAKLERENWTNAALLEYGLKPEHKQFIKGATENSVRTSAYNLSKMLKEKAPAESVTGTGDDGPAPPPLETPPETPKDDAIPVYTGVTSTPSVEECQKAINETIHEQPWVRK